jgi:hypothetical protein
VDRIIAQDRGTFIRWFDLFLEQKGKYRVHEDDIYNMDEKSVALGVAGKQRVKKTLIPLAAREAVKGDCNRDMLLDRVYVAFLEFLQRHQTP